MLKKINLFGRLLTTYVLLVLICFIIYAVLAPLSEGTEKVNIIIGLLGWSAAIFTPIAAVILIDNWKEQIRHEKALDCLIKASSIIQTMHSKIISFQLKNISKELDSSFYELNPENFILSTNSIKNEFKEEFLNYKKNYDELSILLNQFELITENSIEKFQDILDSYFKINWYFTKILDEYLQYYIIAKNNNDNLESFKQNSAYLIRTVQFNFTRDPKKQKSDDGQYIFMSTLYMAQIKQNSFAILKDTRKTI